LKTVEADFSNIVFKSLKCWGTIIASVLSLLPSLRVT